MYVCIYIVVYGGPQYSAVHGISLKRRVAFWVIYFAAFTFLSIPSGELHLFQSNYTRVRE